ncbi:MAG TPA: zinc ribbon domain-containing protein [Symbiobacteriaceae bacterium]|nr:zinc ribbon domain-containing protein [Symbiobacteriaceae bacterium]
MPMYSFECQQCGKRFEEIVAYDRRGEVVCPSCQGAARVMVSTCSVGTGATASAVRSSGFS